MCAAPHSRATRSRRGACRAGHPGHLHVGCVWAAEAGPVGAVPRRSFVCGVPSAAAAAGRGGRRGQVRAVLHRAAAAGGEHGAGGAGRGKRAHTH